MNESINQLINDEAVYRTAPATPGLLIIKGFEVIWDKSIVCLLANILYLHILVYKFSLNNLPIQYSLQNKELKIWIKFSQKEEYFFRFFTNTKTRLSKIIQNISSNDKYDNRVIPFKKSDKKHDNFFLDFLLDKSKVFVILVTKIFCLKILFGDIWQFFLIFFFKSQILFKRQNRYFKKQCFIISFLF